MKTDRRNILRTLLAAPFALLAAKAAGKGEEPADELLVDMNGADPPSVGDMLRTPSAAHPIGRVVKSLPDGRVLVHIQPRRSGKQAALDALRDETDPCGGCHECDEDGEPCGLCPDDELHEHDQREWQPPTNDRVHWTVSERGEVLRLRYRARDQVIEYQTAAGIGALAPYLVTAEAVRYAFSLWPGPLLPGFPDHILLRAARGMLDLPDFHGFVTGRPASWSSDPAQRFTARFTETFGSNEALKVMSEDLLEKIKRQGAMGGPQ